MKIRPQEAKQFCLDPSSAIFGVLLYGENQGLVSERANTLVEAILGSQDDAFRFTDISAAQLKAGEIFLQDEIKAASLMGGRRVVRLAEAKNTDAGNIKLALDVAIEGDALMVASAGSQGPRDALRKLFESHKAAAAIPCYADEARDLDNLVRQTLTDASVTISRDAQGLLVSRLGNDRGLARRELEKLVTYAGDQEITSEDVRSLIGDAAEFDFEDIGYSVFSGEQAELDQGIDRIFGAKGNPVSLLAAVTRHGQRLHLAASKLAAGSDAENALKALRPPVFFKRKPQFQAQLRIWSNQKLVQALQLLLQAEAQCKTTGLPAETICRRALMRIAAGTR